MRIFDLTWMRELNPAEARAALGDGNFGGYYRRSDEEMYAIWQTGVEATRVQLTRPWG